MGIVWPSGVSPSLDRRLEPLENDLIFYAFE